ncbi:flagellar biosynthesis protein FlgL [Ruegeria sp. 2012CJ41-6]|uniref:Flagellar biosynthesis protein FlgL n=1 Tax=Ruegeria spongiae TaxID=2942209 RepID=A0ABT0Q726_9RHOB|nr:flagellin [Ruegeria spongiae]MCL6285197.1 flagellar biosynthesis protein FlgL [Ruegeria spongiae]
MPLTSIGDLASSLALRTRSAEIKTRIATLTDELSSGQTQNVNTRLAGDYSQLADMDRRLRHLQAFRTVTAEAGAWASGMQTGLTNLHDRVGDLSTKLVTFSKPGQEVTRAHMSKQAADDLKLLVSTLNTRSGGRSLFAGQAVDTTPLADDKTLLSALRTAVSGQTTPVDIIQAATDWFNDPAGFETVIYQGSDQSLDPISVSDTQDASLPLRADHPTFRAILRDTALAALATDPALGFSETVQSDLLHRTGAGLLRSQDELTLMQADLGHVESRIEAAKTQNAAAATATEFARNRLLAADPYDTATHLEAAQFQLESLYAATVRSSQLSLVNYLR